MLTTWNSDILSFNFFFKALQVNMGQMINKLIEIYERRESPNFEHFHVRHALIVWDLYFLYASVCLF